MTSKDDLPAFLYGCFDWRVNGLHWEVPPDLDLKGSKALRSDNPWLVLAAVVERAKSGDHSQAAMLVQLAIRREPFALDRVSLLAFADLAPTKDLALLEQLLRGDDEVVRGHAAEAAALTGALNLVPALLSAWERASSGKDHDRIAFALSDMLEFGGGLIAEASSRFDLPPLRGTEPEGIKRHRARLAESPREPPPLPGLVREAHAQLAASIGSDAIVWEGEKYSVPELVEAFLRQVKSPERRNFIDLRHRFESQTGIDCRKFYFAMQPQRLQMAATLEDFLRSDQPARYEPGVRYFFGHRIPD